MGADEFTSGRPHPMIDGTARAERIIEESHDREVAILLLDFVLGHNASGNPAGELIFAIKKSRENVSERGGSLAVVALICGTGDDPQEISKQPALLRDEGIAVFGSICRAAQYCVNLLQ